MRHGLDHSSQKLWCHVWCHYRTKLRPCCHSLWGGRARLAEDQQLLQLSQFLDQTKCIQTWKFTIHICIYMYTLWKTKLWPRHYHRQWCERDPQALQLQDPRPTAAPAFVVPPRALSARAPLRCEAGPPAQHRSPAWAEQLCRGSAVDWVPIQTYSIIQYHTVTNRHQKVDHHILLHQTMTCTQLPKCHRRWWECAALFSSSPGAHALGADWKKVLRQEWPGSKSGDALAV